MEPISSMEVPNELSGTGSEEEGTAPREEDVRRLVDLAAETAGAYSTCRDMERMGPAMDESLIKKVHVHFMFYFFLSVHLEKGNLPKQYEKTAISFIKITHSVDTLFGSTIEILCKLLSILHNILQKHLKL